MCPPGQVQYYNRSNKYDNFDGNWEKILILNTDGIYPG